MGIEYSANLDAKFEMSELCALVHASSSRRGLFEPGAARVRAFRADPYAIADRLPENGFIDMDFRIGRGRSAEEKKRTGEAIFTGVIARVLCRHARPAGERRDQRRDLSARA